MAFCPCCHAEYVPSIRRCPDCDVELVSQLPAEIWEVADWVPVYRASDELDATMIRGIVEAEQIPCWIRRNVIPWYDGIRGSWFQGHWGELLVPKELAHDAQQIIEEYLRGMPYDEENDQESHL